MIPATPAPLFDRGALRRARTRRAERFAESSFLHRRVFDSLLERLDSVARSFALALVTGGGGSAILPLNAPRIGQSLHMDLSPAPERPPEDAALWIQGDIERLPLRAGAVDLVLSLLDLHMVDDLPGALTRVRQVLQSDGLFLGALFGGRTLTEMRTVLAESEVARRGGLSPRVHPFASAGQMAALMQRAGFALPVVDSEIFTVTYPTLRSLIDDLRGMGETNVLTARLRGLTGKTLFEDAQALYRARFADPDGRLRATFEVLFLSGWAP